MLRKEFHKWMNNSPNYLNAREELIAKNNGKCQECGYYFGKKLNCHHIRYRVHPDLQKKEDFVVVCFSCHGFIHGTTSHKWYPKWDEVVKI